MVPKVSKWGFQGGISIEKWSQNFDSGTRSTIFGTPKTAKMTYFGRFGDTKNGPSSARIKILRQLFNTNTPQNPHLDTLGTILDPRKVIFSHFVLFVEFWSFSRAGGYFFGKVYDFQSQFHLSKQYSFFNIRVPPESSLHVDFKYLQPLKALLK